MLRSSSSRRSKAEAAVQRRHVQSWTAVRGAEPSPGDFPKDAAAFPTPGTELQQENRAGKPRVWWPVTSRLRGEANKHAGGLLT
ncbi:hypothetical protein SRHO_G00138890 [Serrasalmus rhombeus]